MPYHDVKYVPSQHDKLFRPSQFCCHTIIIMINIFVAKRKIINKLSYHVLYYLNPFIFSKNKHCAMSSEGVTALVKNAVTLSQRPMLLIQLSVKPAVDSYGHMKHFFLRNLLDQVWQPAADFKGCLTHFKYFKSVPNHHNYCTVYAAGCQTQPVHSAEQFAEGRRALQAVKKL